MLNRAYLHCFLAFQLCRQDFREDLNGLHGTPETSGTVPAGNLTTLQPALGGCDAATGAGAITAPLSFKWLNSCEKSR